MIDRLRQREARAARRPVRVICVHEAGYEGFWLHPSWTLLLSSGVGSQGLLNTGHALASVRDPQRSFAATLTGCDWRWRSFMRFAGLALEDRVPDAKMIWLYREQLTQAGRHRASVRQVR